MSLSVRGKLVKLVKLIVALCLLSAALFAHANESAAIIDQNALPRKLAGYILEKSTNFEEKHKGLGRSFQYFRREINASVYIYNLQHAIIAEGVHSGIVKTEFINAKRDVLSRPGNAHQLGEDAITSVGAMEFITAIFQLSERRQAFRSLLFVTAKHNHFIKVRVSFAEGSEFVHEVIEFQKFLKELCLQLDSPR